MNQKRMIYENIYVYKKLLLSQILLFAVNMVYSYSLGESVYDDKMGMSTEYSYHYITDNPDFKWNFHRFFRLSGRVSYLYEEMNNTAINSCDAEIVLKIKQYIKKSRVKLSLGGNI